MADGGFEQDLNQTLTEAIFTALRQTQAVAADPSNDTTCPRKNDWSLG